MAIKEGMRGVAVKSDDGYIFYPEYDPATGDKALAIPLDSKTFFMAGFSQAASLQTSDITPAAPSISGYIAAPDRILSAPITITDGVSIKSASSGQTQTLATFLFFWDGSTNVYLSADPDALKQLIIDDGLVITTPRGSYSYSANPIYNNYIQLSDGLKTGVNAVTVTLKNNYGSKTSASPVYLLIGNSFDTISNIITALPVTITSGVSVKSASSGYTETLKELKIYWDGANPVYLSAASNALKQLIIDDTLIVATDNGNYTYGADPFYNNYIDISSRLNQGPNNVTVTLKNNYGSNVSASEVYLLTGSGLNTIDNTVAALPLQITSGVASRASTTGETQTLISSKKLYWDGSGSIWISGAAGPAYISTDDTLIISSQKDTYTVGADPQLEFLYDVTSIFEAGINTVTVTLKNAYGATIGTSALYFILN